MSQTLIYPYLYDIMFLAESKNEKKKIAPCVPLQQARNETLAL